MNKIDCLTLIKDKLTAALNPIHLEISDNSVQHAGHAGTEKDKAHCTITIVSAIFIGKTLIQRHRLVYAVLDELMKTSIHALSINALTPDEFTKV